MLRFLPKVGICTGLGTIPAMCKGVWKTAHAQLPLEISTPFLEPDDLSTSWSWEFPDCYPSGKKVPLFIYLFFSNFILFFNFT